MTEEYTPIKTSALNWPCRRCQYDLRGLPESAQCPECGLPYDEHSTFIPLIRKPLWIIPLFCLIVIGTGIYQGDHFQIAIAALAFVYSSMVIYQRPGAGSYILIHRAGVTWADTKEEPKTFPWHTLGKARFNFWLGTTWIKDKRGRTLLRLRPSDTGTMRICHRIARKIDELAKVYKEESARAE